MSKSSINLQDNFLNQIRKEKIPVTVHLLNGTKITGLIKGFDNFIIFLKNETQYLVYKHSVSAVVPQKNLKSFETHEGEEAKGAALKPEETAKGPDVKKRTEGS
ncbi:MAG: RNA chaperone Hfq [Nitrospirae bacterium]|nr:RNA chaperone Hfq [Nitrospirota bacterium]